MRLLSAALALLFATSAVAKTPVSSDTNDATCPDKPGSKVTSLPQWRQGDTLPCMYAGTLAASSAPVHNLFYWLFKNTKLENPSLVLWLNGGPGSSSMFGLFMENGPLRVKSTGPGKGDLEVGLTSDGYGSWLDDADVVFLDNPVGAGFSYGEKDSLATSMQQISDEML